MPPDRGRAGKACYACRKQKTRCYPPEKPGAGCLRCETLRTACSFTAERTGSVGVSPNFATTSGGNVVFASESTLPGPVSGTDVRLARLENAVNSLLDRFTGDGSPRRGESRDSTPLTGLGRAIHPQSPKKSVGAALDEDAVAPVFVLRDLAAETGAGAPSANAVSSTMVVGEDIITSGLITLDDAVLLISIFQEHYGRWVVFDPSMAPEHVLVIARKSPLLLCACCLIAIRHFSVEAAGKLAPRIFDTAKALLSANLLLTPQRIEFFQAVIVLCMWSTTVGQTPLSIDSWLVSGFALQHAYSTKIFASIVSGSIQVGQSGHTLHRLSIWTHLCLVHLHYCVGTRRKAIIGRHQIERCQDILHSDHATNFETRMVAEVNLYWIIYEYCTGTTLDLPKAQANLHDWKRKWNFLLEQPRGQFLEMGFHFAQLLAYERALKSRSASVRDSLLNEMIRLSAAMINLAIDTTDERTRHLTDHIFHMITFAAVTLCRLLNHYEAQLATNHNIAELDTLILKIGTWLTSIGLSCHTGHTLGRAVAAIHVKLRPNAQPVAQPVVDIAVNDWMMQSFVPNFLPDILDTEISPGGNWNFAADWEPYGSRT